MFIPYYLSTVIDMINGYPVVKTFHVKIHNKIHEIVNNNMN